jgi:transcriptional regulator with XRE-family HTH domain
MSELVERLRTEFSDKEYRHAYVEECLNTMVATQIKVLREQREMTQAELADDSGMKQPRLSVLEQADYSNWSINTLKRLARAFDVALTVRFDAFSDVILDFEGLSRASLQRPSFKEDPLFKSSKVSTSRKFKRCRGSSTMDKAMGGGQLSFFGGQLLTLPLEIVQGSAQPETTLRFTNYSTTVTQKAEGKSNAATFGVAG